ncbi:TPA: glycosyltransferase family 9 protein [Campylobacter coli]|nr:glycosyltransferase family 9 protein [Campylobacter coli]HEG0268970.1 glycosyltransferase family 9 protein [Campylobacter coli]HEG0335953.1 glycosyltransferase family 9 protein [Campylobacter coli]HEG0348570.1 glycosyltransferase family 9 protein [Campylobacter coli]HEG0350331.1 glycosyltransferase family 9 protein [Campylobacter coli]
MKILKPNNKFYKIQLNNKRYEKKLAIHFSAGLGDYLMFRPFLKEIRAYYKNYHISIIGEQSFKDLCLEYDKDCIDEFIYFKQNMGFNAYVMPNIHYDILLSAFHKLHENTENNVNCIQAKEKICLIYGCSELSLNDRERIANTVFTKAIYLKNQEDFQALHYQEFFEILFNKKINFKINLELDMQYYQNINFDFNAKYAVIFAGSKDKSRIWNAKNYEKVCEFLYEKYGIVSFIAGSKNEEKIAKKIINSKQYVVSICGKYNIKDIIYITSKAKLVISNDSGGYHLACNVSKNIICISSGACFAENVNYPQKLFLTQKNISTPIAQKALENKYSEYWRFDKKLLDTIKTDEICKLIDLKYSKELL